MEDPQVVKVGAGMGPTSSQRGGLGPSRASTAHGVMGRGAATTPAHNAISAVGTPFREWRVRESLPVGLPSKKPNQSAQNRPLRSRRRSQHTAYRFLFLSVHVAWHTSWTKHNGHRQGMIIADRIKGGLQCCTDQ